MPMIYQSINQAVFEGIPPGTRSLLDVGCGGGVFGAAVKSARECTVVGVTYSEAEAVQARQRLDRVAVADLNDFEPAGLGTFDCIVCSHVLEHLHDPQQVLNRLRACMAPGGVLLVALPNVLFWKQRLEFVRGRFRYTEGGLMDRTHVRFFDWHSADQLVRDAGFEVVERVADGVFPLSRLFGSALSGRINRAALRRLPGLFGVQFVLRCVPAAA
jgi:SAM-dependent methyltransferase